MTVPLPSLFQRRTLTPDGIRINTLAGGKGSPVLLLHGYPQTHVMWHHVAPILAEHHSVVLTDLRGYGDSGKPAGGHNHEAYAKRTMAADQVLVMRELGFDEFAVVGHDRGARVAHRMALDYPQAVTKIAVLDIVPTRHALHNADKTFGLGYWHWFFLAQPDDLPERMIGADPDAFYFQQRYQARDRFAREALDDYLRCARRPETIHAMCEDYRAGATIDRDHDEADRGRRRIDCPLLVLWGGRGKLPELYDDVLALWRGWADDVRGRALDCGHFLPEEAPGETLSALLDFFEAAP